MVMYKKDVLQTYIKDLFCHANLIYAHADSQKIAEALEATNSNIEVHKDSAKRRWECREDELLAFCGLV